MQSIVHQLGQRFVSAIEAAFGFPSDPLIGLSQNDKFGDYQSNAAMGLARIITEKTGQKITPRAVAEKIREKLDLSPLAAEVSIAGPGFINVKLDPVWLARQLQAVVADDRLGIPRSENPQTVVVDYSGPNIAKQMHVGHLRSTIIGDAISRVLDFQDHRVIRQNHLGDWGTQFGMLITHLRSLNQGSGESHIADLEDFYRAAKKRFDDDPAFQDEARRTVVRLQAGNAQERAAWARIVDETRRHFQPLYEAMAVKLQPQDERGESFYNPFLAGVVSELKAQGLAVESDGAVVVFVDGPDKTPLIIEKTGGGYLYGTTDLAAIRYRVSELHADRIIYTHDSRQAQHFDQVFRTAANAGWTNGGQVKLEYAPFGTMLGEDGKPFKTRSGETVKLKDLLDEARVRALSIVEQKNLEMPERQKALIAEKVGIGAVKYSDLSKDRISDYVFSWDKMLAMDGNTAPYLQYAFARIQAIFRKAQGAGLLSSKPAPINLDSPFELILAKHLLRLVDVIELVGRELKPHHLCTYLYELASKFSSFYENCPVLQAPDAKARESRLALSDATRRTLALGLDLLGIDHPEQM